jgi:flagellar protein FlaI
MLNGRVIFRKFVKGYKILKKGKLVPPGIDQIPITFPTSFPMEPPKQPLEVTGELRLLPPEKPELEGIEIPPFKSRMVTKAGLKEEMIEEAFETTYPLIPEKPTKGEPVFAYAQIKWNQQRNRYEYLVYQPTLSPETKRLFLKIKRLLEEKLDVDLTKLKETEAKEYLTKQVSELMEYFRIKLTETERQVLSYYIDRDFLGFGVIEPLIRDPEIEDISCDGVGIPIFVFHRNPILGSLPTNIVFSSNEELDSYLVRLAQLCGQAISVMDPLLDGTLPEGSRIQATLGTDIARRGSNFSIRKFTKFPFTPTHLLKYGTVDIKSLAYLWMTIDYGCSVLISGGTATGKTVFLNVLSLFIKPEMKIVSIEDTAELRLPHPHWVPHVARVAIATEEGKRKGEIDLFDLLKESMRQRPDYIILGEVRGKEAYVLFQQMATGHPSLATIHADSFSKLINRLITPPISLPPSLLETLDLVVFLTNMKYKGKYARKVESVHEVTGFDFKKKQITTNMIFEWDAITDKIITKNKSFVLKKIAKKTGLNEKKIIDELGRRMAVLNWLQEKNITDYRDVSQVINLYYSFPEKVLDIISGEI